MQMKATPDMVEQKLDELDKVLGKRTAYLSAREQRLDSITANIGPEPADTAAAYLRLGESIASYSVGQSIKYLKKGLTVAEENGLDHNLVDEYRLALASTYPANGFIAEALATFKAVRLDSLPNNLHSKYYCAGEKMYETILEYYADTNIDTKSYEDSCAEFRQKAMRYFAPESPEWLLRESKLYVAYGIHRAAQVTLYDIIDRLEDTHPAYTEAARLMAKCATATGLEHDNIYYMAASAIGEIKRGDREGVALHLTGQQLFYYGDVDRAHSYLSKAIESIPEPGAQSLRSEALIRTLMTIDDSFDAKLNNNIKLFCVLIAMLVLWVVLTTISLINHKKMVNRLSRERHLVIEANNAKETFLQNFLELGIVSAKRLVSFRKLVNRKVAAGQYSDLYETSKSTRIIDEQRKQFLTIFDASLLSIYPTFIDEINRLLRPDERYDLHDNHLPSELRVIALVRLGVDDVNQIAEALTFSVGTVYAYKAKVRNKAINRDTFDSDLMNVGTMPPFSVMP